MILKTEMFRYTEEEIINSPLRFGDERTTLEWDLDK